MTTMNDDLDQLLATLQLKKIRQILPRELDRAATSQPSYADFLARLFREEALYRRERSVLYRIRQAKLPERWSLDTFPFDRQPGVHRAGIRQLAELDWVGAAKNLVFIGPTGVGKTGLASALLLKALENGYRGLFLKAQDLFDELYTSLADRSTRKLLDQLARVDVLLVDEMGYLNLRPEQTNAFFKLMEERYRRKPTLITTNLAYDDWYGFLGNKQMVGALLDRLRHHCQTILIDGPSLRDPQS
jgi:DNA replication protein DnaC